MSDDWGDDQTPPHLGYEQYPRVKRRPYDSFPAGDIIMVDRVKHWVERGDVTWFGRCSGCTALYMRTDPELGGGNVRSATFSGQVNRGIWARWSCHLVINRDGERCGRLVFELQGQEILQATYRLGGMDAVFAQVLGDGER